MDTKMKVYILYVILLVETITIGISMNSIISPVVMIAALTLFVFEKPKKVK